MRADRPDILVIEGVEGRTGEVEEADVAPLPHLLALVLLEPPEREPLGAADVRAEGVDAAAPRGVEKGAPPVGEGPLP